MSTDAVRSLDRPMESIVARKMWRTLEPYHTLVYFSPRAGEVYGRLGLPPYDDYFASRAAPMGPVPAEVVMATFYNFSPALVAWAIPRAWEIASPEVVLDARYEVIDTALRDALGDEVLTSPEMQAAAEAARRAADACHPEGRPLYAAHARLPWPDEPHLVLWHAITLLREFRGDGHVAALVVAGLDGCEALVSYGAVDETVLPFLKASRGWTDDDFAAARRRLQERGWLDEAGGPTEECVAGRERIETATDEAAMAPWRTLGDDACAELRARVRPWSRAIVSSGVLTGSPY